MKHSFRFYRSEELEDKTLEELDHLALVDQLLAVPAYDDIDPRDLEAMRTDDLRELLGRVRPARPKGVRADLPDWAQLATAKPPKRDYSPPPRKGKRYRALVWDPEQCTMVHIGVFDTEQARDAAVLEAKGRRALGLPLK